MQFLKTHIRTAVLVALALTLVSSTAHAQYVQLQVLLPGETEAPGTSSGKLGTPSAQTVGIPFNLTVRACDANWNTMTSITNVVQLSSSEALATLPAAASLMSGTVSLSVTLNAAGSFTLSADDQSDPTIPLATSANVTTFLLQGFDFSRINQKNQTAGIAMNITLWAVDPNDNVVTGFSGPVLLQEITSFGNGRITPSVVNLTNGTWTGGLTMFRADETSINRGNVNVFASLPGDPTKNGTSDPFTVHPGPFTQVQIVVAGQSPAPGTVNGLTGSPASQAAGQLFQVDVYSTDDFWNPVPSIDVVRITSSDPAASTPVTDALLNGFVQLILSLGTVGTQTLTVTDQTNGAIQGMTSAGILVTPSAPDHFEIDPIPSPLTAGTSIPVTIRATDVGGNTVPDFSGNGILVANTGPGSITPEAIVFVAGVWTGNMVFRGAGGAVALTCADFASPPHIGTSNNFQVLPAAFSGMQILLPGQTPRGGTAIGFTGTPTDQNAGASFNLTVRAVDQFWNRVSGVNHLFSLTSTDTFAAMPSDTTLINGELIFPVRLHKGGSQTITVTDIDTTGITPHTSSPVNILPGTYSRILLIAPGEIVAPGLADGRSGAATDQSINFSFTVTVYATDQWFNPMGGVTDVVRITSGDPLAQLPPDTPLANGRADLTMRLSTGGFQQITAENLTQPAMPTSTTQVKAISSGFHLEADVSPTNVGAGEPFNLTVRVTNDAGSVIQEINSFVTVVVQNASTQAPGQGTLLNTQFQLLQGERTIAETYTFAEDIVLVITDDAGNDPAVSAVVMVTPGTPADIQLTSNPPWVHGNSNSTIRARLVDAYDNGFPGAPMVFQMVSGTGTLTPIDSLTNNNGVALADFAAPRVPEIDRIRATSGAIVAEIDVETAFVDPSKPAGSITNYPNPFHPNEAPTTIAYKISDDATVTIRIYTLSGGLVLKTTFDQGTPGGVTGLNEFQWDGRNGDGELVASGGYIVVVEAVGNGETLQTMRRKIGVVR
ncbi:MAG: FlgD immunoglobulin-like domain containing protein [Candidatus Krumholzibacteria bacterium]